MRRNNCVNDLKKVASNGDISEDMFVDACLLAGSHFLPTLPNLDSPQRSNKLKPIGAIEMIMNNGRTGMTLVLNNQDDPRLQNTQYVDRYRRARLAVKHHPVLTMEGKIEPSVQSELPNDTHEVIGQRLPDEIYHYLSKGLINARILNWRATSEIIEVPPVDGGDSVEYQNLVSSKLTPLRTTAINLLSTALHNWYQHKDITLRCWFSDGSGKPYTNVISIRGLPESRRSVEMWNVKEATFKDAISRDQVRSRVYFSTSLLTFAQSTGYLGSAILALKNEEFVAKTSSKKDVSQVSLLDLYARLKLTKLSLCPQLTRSSTIPSGGFSHCASTLM